MRGVSTGLPANTVNCPCWRRLPASALLHSSMLLFFHTCIHRNPFAWKYSSLVKPLHCKSSFNIISSSASCCASRSSVSCCASRCSKPLLHVVGCGTHSTSCVFQALAFHCTFFPEQYQLLPSAAEASWAAAVSVETTPQTCPCVVLSKIPSGMFFLQDPFCTEGVKSQVNVSFSVEV